MCMICGMPGMRYSSQDGTSSVSSGGEIPNYGGSGANTQIAMAATSDVNINGVLSGLRWTTGTLTYSFPTLTSQYEGGYSETGNNFATATEALKTATRYAMNLLSQYTNMVTSEVDASTTNADIRSAFSDSANPTAYAYYPSNGTKGGDVWYGSNYPEYANPVKGQYAWTTVLHEIGHSLGLKHGHETGGPANTAVSAAYDQMAYTLMTYRSYQGGPTTGYTNETNGYAQTFMMYDIAALQAMYGANYNTNSTATTYTWSTTTGEMFINGVGQGAPGGNRIFMTIWDGNGTDTYDFSNYTTNLSVNLDPGAYSITNTSATGQRAHLGNGNYAPGNIFNALTVGGDVRSMIENANGGSGNDTILGNSVANVLNGGGGDDWLYGQSGSDHLIGGSNNDNLFGGLGGDLIDGGDGFDYARYDDAEYGSIVVSMLSASNASIGTGAAAGDAFSNIEGIILGGGNDWIYGDSLGNYIYGQGGNDNIFGSLGADYIHGGAGFDYARFDDASYAGLVADLVGANTNTGAAAGDTYVDIEGLILTGNNDYGFGNTADNYLYGLGGIDYLSGREGVDYLDGGIGNDTLNGGSGNDTFAFRAGYGRDTVEDFSGGSGIADVLDLRGVFGSFAAVMASSVQVGGNLEIRLNGSDILVLQNFYIGNFAADDVLLV